MPKKIKITLKEKVEKFIFNNPFFVLFWMLIVLLSSIITIANGTNIVMQKYKDTIGYKQEQYDKLSALKTNVDINTYFETFGKPIRVVSDPDLNIKTYIFNNKYYYLDAITNRDNAVYVYGVTTKTKDFQPTFTAPNGLKITLNKTTLHEIYPEIITTDYDSTDNFIYDACYGFWDNRRLGYFESHYLANPGKYQTIIVGINDAGSIVDSQQFIDTLLSLNLKGRNGIECKKINKNARKEAHVNTYRITRPFLNIPHFATNSGLFIGVDYDELRVMEDR